MKILVTGGSGFLGLELVTQLLHAGHEVISLQRTRSKKLDELGVQQVLVDLADREKTQNVFQQLTPLDIIFHTAAKAGYWGNFQSYYSANVVATKNLLSASKLAKVSYFIYTSTPSVVYGENDLENIDESMPYPAKFLTPYAATKAEAEKLVLANHSDQLQVIALRPHLIWGKNDPHLLPRILKRAKSRALWQIGSGHNLVDTIHVTNAAYAHLCALNFLKEDKKNGGKAYFVGQERPLPLWWFINKLLEVHGYPPVKRSMSLKAAYILGAVSEIIYRIIPWLGEPKMTRFLALQLGTSHYFNQSAAITDLAYRPQFTIEDGLRTL